MDGDSRKLDLAWRELVDKTVRVVRDRPRTHNYAGEPTFALEDEESNVELEEAIGESSEEEIDPMDPLKRCMHAYCRNRVAAKNAGKPCKICKRSKCMNRRCKHEIHVKNRLMRCASCKRFKCLQCIDRLTHYRKDILPAYKCDYCSISLEDGLDFAAHRDPVEGAIAAASMGFGSLAAKRKKEAKRNKKIFRKQKKAEAMTADGSFDQEMEDGEVESLGLKRGEESPDEDDETWEMDLAEQDKKRPKKAAPAPGRKERGKGKK